MPDRFLVSIYINFFVKIYAIKTAIYRVFDKNIKGKKKELLQLLYKRETNNIDLELHLAAIVEFAFLRRKNLVRFAG